MIKSADSVYLVADSSKIGVSSLANLGSISLVQTMITDSKITGEGIEKIKRKNVEILFP